MTPRLILLLLCASPLPALAQEDGFGPMVPDRLYCAVNSDDEKARVTFRSDGRMVTLPERGGREEDLWFARAGLLCLKRLESDKSPVCFSQEPRGDDGAFALRAGIYVMEFRACDGADQLS